MTTPVCQQTKIQGVGAAIFSVNFFLKFLQVQGQLFAAFTCELVTFTKKIDWLLPFSVFKAIDSRP